MSLNPRFAPQAAEVLQHSPDTMYHRIMDTVDLICEQPDSRDVRRRSLRTPKGTSAWIVDIRGTDWALIWTRNEDTAIISYIGAIPSAR